MKLYHNPASPYTRKVMVLAHETGLIDRISLMPIKVWEETDRIRSDNPLGKIPTLINDQGQAVYDSTVICAYLDTLHNGPKMIPEGEARWPVEILHALAQGMTDAALTLRADVMRGREKEPDFYSKRMRATIKSACDEAERRITEIEGHINLATIAMGVGLAYVDFRFPELGWREGHPRLTEWYGAFAKRPSMKATPTA